MVTCKDCVHHEVCFNYVIGDEVERCGRFKNIADVAEVKHGMWGVFGLINPQCSLCRGYNIVKSRYCPHCGAKMDGGEEHGS